MSLRKGLLLLSLAFAAILMAGCSNSSSSAPVASLSPEFPGFDVGDSTPAPPVGGVHGTPSDVVDESPNLENPSLGAPPLEAPPQGEVPGTPASPEPPRGVTPGTPPLEAPGTPASPEPPRGEEPSTPPLEAPGDDDGVIAGNPDGGDEGNLSDEDNTPELGTCALLLLSGITAGAARLRRRKKS